MACTVARDFCIYNCTFWRCFASGFKRAFKIKDFGDSIPGHGGMTDRMDCQMVMAVFAYKYHQSFITPQSVSVEMILDQLQGAAGIVHKACADNSGEPIWKILN